MSRTWLYVFRSMRPGEVRCVFYHDDPPSPQMLKHLPDIIRRWEVTGTIWATRSLHEIEAEYHRRVARGDLPP